MLALVLVAPLSGLAQYFSGYYALGSGEGTFVPPETGTIGNWRVASLLVPPDHSYVTIANVGSADEFLRLHARNWGSGEPGKFIEMLIPADTSGLVAFQYTTSLENDGTASWTNDGGITWHEFMDTEEPGMIYGTPLSFQVVQGVDFGFRVETTSAVFGYDQATLQVRHLVVSAIPEPSTYAALAGVAVLGLAFWRRRSARLNGHSAGPKAIR